MEETFNASRPVPFFDLEDTNGLEDINDLSRAELNRFEVAFTIPLMHRTYCCR